jgi:hypothetical protein
MPDRAGREEMNPGTAPDEAQLLARRVVTDQDVLDRVTAIIGPAARDDPTRTLWLFFLAADGTQENLVVPVIDVPECPPAPMIGNICYVATEVIAQRLPGGSVILTLSRPGTAEQTSSDSHFLGALQRGASAHGTPVRMLCLATPAGTRKLGPASPAADTHASPPEPGT